MLTRLQRWLVAMGIILLVPACVQPAPKITCVNGVVYVSEYRGGITVAVDREGNPLQCSA